MDSLTFYVILLVAVIAGWLLGSFGSKKSAPAKSASSDWFQDYFVGLNYLLNDEPDEAIDTFIKALEVNSETIETHLALGALLRRRGKVDQAINVHQTLLARPNLERSFANSVRLQLALDYIAAGLLDRAERLSKEVLEDGSPAQWEALEQLITIYQTEKEWENAITCCAELLKNPSYKKDVSLLGSAAHFCCELAEQYLHSGQDSLARTQIKRAFTFERKSVRAMLLLADIEQREGNFKAAIKELQRVRAAKPEFIPQLLGKLAFCHEKLGSQLEFEKQLGSMVTEDSSIDATLLLARRIGAKSGNAAAMKFLNTHLDTKPSLNGLIELLRLQLDVVDEDVASNLESLLNLVQKQAQESSEYQCHHCGFDTKSFFWMCPSCKKWDTIRPIDTLPNRLARIVSS
ncbi:MAG: lipopolysaccharide assembly protein LapB [Pseudohongiellaceae bacterium]